MTDTPAKMEARLADEDLRHVFVEFPDVNGMSRSKQLTRDRFLETWESGIPVNLLLLVQTPRNEVPKDSGFGKEIGYGDGRLRPDPSTVRVLPWREDAARVLCDVEYEGEPVRAAPRTALRHLLESTDLDLEFGVGCELEFYLLGETETGHEPATDHKHEWVSEATERLAPFVDRLAEWAPAYGVPLYSVEHEHGPGQVEALFDHDDPLAAADTAFDFKRLVKRTAAVTGRVGTFMAKPFGGESGSGFHLHVSAQRNGENAFDDGDGGLSETGRQFVGGVLEHADALTAVGTPTRNGFKRFGPGGFAPYSATWGYDNRMTALRVPAGYTRIENRIAAASANPHLLVAATLAAGIDGVRRDLDPGPVTEGEPGADAPVLPQTPTRAFEALATDDRLAELLGREVVDAYVATRRRDLAALDDRVTDWERERYVDVL